MDRSQSHHLPPLAEDFDDFFDTSLCGFIVTDADSNILRINLRAAEWLRNTPAVLSQKRFSDILAVGSKIYFETHLWPLMRMQGYFDEVAVDLSDNGEGKLPVYINGYERRTDSGQPMFIRFTLFRASDRRMFEQNLQISKQLAETKLITEQQNAVIREQFIAVLGHDLRNPLGAVIIASQMLEHTECGKKEQKLIQLLRNSSKRMKEMIDNIMDLARGRLGGGITISPELLNLDQLLMNVTEELTVAWPSRSIDFEFKIDKDVVCDRGRIAQLVSNLLANAITHGSETSAVILKAISNEGFWEFLWPMKVNRSPKKLCRSFFILFTGKIPIRAKMAWGLGCILHQKLPKRTMAYCRLNPTKSKPVLLLGHRRLKIRSNSFV
jgi:sigma-B regulation protein RsbU (phosphoserine phosphatase)